MLRSSCLRHHISRSSQFLSGINLPHSHLVRHSSTDYSQGSNTGRESSKWQGRARSLLCAGIFVGIGLTFGFGLQKKMSQPPTPGSPEDAEDTLGIKIMQSTYESLPVVAELRANPDFEEQGVNNWDDLSEEEKARYFTVGALGGTRGLAVLNTFWNEKEKLAVSVVFFGPGLEGWPFFVHGGAISTALDERLGRVALRMVPEGTGVTANLNINYRAPVLSGSVYIMHAKYNDEKSSERKAFVEGTIRDSRGNMCTEATGLFVVPKTLKLKRHKEINSA